MKLLTPKMYYPNIYEIDYKKLKELGIKCLLFDFDNTCMGYKDKNLSNELITLFKKLKKMGFFIIIFSNARNKRLNQFKEINIDYNSLSKKPLQIEFKKILTKYNYKKEELCIIGDQIFTDILGGNRFKIQTCLVDPLTNKDFIITKLFRQIEKRIIKKLKYTTTERK